MLVPFGEDSRDLARDDDDEVEEFVATVLDGKGLLPLLLSPSLFLGDNDRRGELVPEDEADDLTDALKPFCCTGAATTDGVDELELKLVAFAFTFAFAATFRFEGARVGLESWLLGWDSDGSRRKAVTGLGSDLSGLRGEESCCRCLCCCRCCCCGSCCCFSWSFCQLLALPALWPLAVTLTRDLVGEGSLDEIGENAGDVDSVAVGEAMLAVLVSAAVVSEVEESSF